MAGELALWSDAHREMSLARPEETAEVGERRAGVRRVDDLAIRVNEASGGLGEGIEGIELSVRRRVAALTLSGQAAGKALKTPVLLEPLLCRDLDGRGAVPVAEITLARDAEALEDRTREIARRRERRRSAR